MIPKQPSRRREQESDMLEAEQAGSGDPYPGRPQRPLLRPSFGFAGHVQVLTLTAASTAAAHLVLAPAGLAGAAQ